MTVSSTTTKNSYSGNGSTTTFAYSFKIFADADLTVILRSAAGTETVQSLTTNYSVTNAGNANGGNVVFGTAPASGVTVVIRRNIAQTQTTDYTANDPFPAESHEDALDRLTFITQQQQEELDRSIKLSRTNTMTSTEFTVGATDRANKILAFDSSGEISVTQELGTYKGTDATVTTEAYAVRDIIKSTTTAQLNNVYICVATSVVGDSLTDTDHFELLVDAVSAASSATTATTKAGEASTSASAAAGSATTAESHKDDAETAKAAAETAQAAAVTAKNAAETAADNFDDTYLGAKSSDPSVDNDGDALSTGDLYFNTTSDAFKVYNGSAWQTVTSGTVISAMVDDTTPQLGGNLDMNGKDIVTTSNATIDLAPNGTGTVVVRGNTNSGAIVFNCEANTHGQTLQAQPHSAGVTNTMLLPAGSNSTLVSESATQTLTNKTISGGAVSGITDLAIADGGTGASSASAARTALGLEIGTDIQAFNGDTVFKDVQNTFTKAQVPSTYTAALSATSGVLDYDTYQNFIITLASGSNTLAAVTTEASQVGQTGVIIFIQPSSSSAATISLHGDYETAEAAGLTLSSANNDYDVVPYIVKADNSILLGAAQLNFG